MATEQQNERPEITLTDIMAEIQDLKELVMAANPAANNRKTVKNLGNMMRNHDQRLERIEEALSGSEEEREKEQTQAREEPETEENEPKF